MVKVINEINDYNLELFFKDVIIIMISAVKI